MAKSHVAISAYCATLTGDSLGALSALSLLRLGLGLCTGRVTWYDSAGYCNWLSEQEGIPKEQWCYLPNEAGQYADGMKLASNSLERTGYRLPTEAEWEYACRASAEALFSFGEAGDLISKYSWNLGNSPTRTQSVGKLRPNDLGLFDMHGNVWEWCQNIYKPHAMGENATPDIDDDSDVRNNVGRMLRGGGFESRASSGRLAYRRTYVPTDRYTFLGFRPARTLPPDSLTALPITSNGSETER